MRSRVPKTLKESETVSVSTVRSPVREPSYAKVTCVQRAEVSPTKAPWLLVQDLWSPMSPNWLIMGFSLWYPWPHWMLQSFLPLFMFPWTKPNMGFYICFRQLLDKCLLMAIRVFTNLWVWLNIVRYHYIKVFPSSHVWFILTVEPLCSRQCRGWAYFPGMGFRLDQ